MHECVCERKRGAERGKASSSTKHNIGKFVFHTAPLSGSKYISWEKKTFLRAIPREHFFFLLHMIYFEAAGGTQGSTGECEGAQSLLARQRKQEG